MRYFKKIIIYFLFLFLFFITFGIYFFIYFYLLNLPFTFLHLLFIFIFSLSYFLILNFIHNKIWYFFCNLSLFFFFLFSLINFVYFKVFDNFFNLTFDKINQVNNGMIPLLKDFYILIPKELYFAIILVFVFLVFLSILCFTILRFTSFQRIMFNNLLLSIKIGNKRKLKRLSVSLLLFFIVNIYVFKLVNYLYEHPKDSWYQTRQQIIDLGFLGNFYIQVYAHSNNTENEIIKIKEEKELIDSEQTYLEQSKSLYKQISDLYDIEYNNDLPLLNTNPNILIIQLESVSSWAIDNKSSPMPFLKKLIDNNISVDNFHANSCLTVNAEFSSLCSFLPNSFETIDISNINNYNCLPKILKEEYDYTTNFIHANVPEFYSRDRLGPDLGFENLYFTPYFIQKEDDEFVFNKTIELMKNKEKPSFSYVISFTSHSPYNDELIKYNKEVNDLDIETFNKNINIDYIKYLEDNKFHDQEEIRKYFGFLNATDNALKLMFENLEKSNLLDNTIIIIYGDHRYYNFFKNDINGFYKYNNIPFVMVLPSKEKKKIQNISSHIDIAPTILDLINHDKVDNFLGNSLYDTRFPNQVVNKCLGNVYFMNNDIVIKGNQKFNFFKLFNDNELYNVDHNFIIEKIKDLIKISDIVIDTDSLIDTKK